jgi:AraC-like DNA-binding protein
VRVYALEWDGGAHAPPAAPGWDRLVSVRGGACRVRLSDSVHVSAPGLGVWIPDGCAAVVDADARVDVRVLYLERTPQPLRGDIPHGVYMTPLLVEIIEREVVLGVFRPHIPAERRLAAAARDEISALAAVQCALPMPRSSAMIAVAEALLLPARSMFTIAQLAQRFNIAERTLERRFAAETGVSPGRWSRAARLLTARASLHSGARVTDAGFDAGYATTSAFIAAYRHAFGTTPRRDAAARISSEWSP